MQTQYANDRSVFYPKRWASDSYYRDLAKGFTEGSGPRDMSDKRAR